jgi:hypothetical protein
MNKPSDLGSVFDVDVGSNVQTNTLTKSENKIYAFARDQSNSRLYDRLDADMALYASKLGSSPVKATVNMLLNRDLIFLGVGQVQAAGNIARLAISNNKLAGVILEASQLEINTQSGETTRIDDAIYAAYYTVIRGVAVINRDKLKSNTTLNNAVLNYLKFLFLKTLKLPQLGGKQLTILEALIGCFYYKFYYNVKASEALALSMKRIKSDDKDEIENMILDASLDRYKEFRDIFKAMVDLRVTFDPPNKLLADIILSLKLSGFLRITSHRLDHLIAAIVTSQYQTGFLRNLNVNTKIQAEVEKEMSNYIKQMTFDTTSLNRVLTNKTRS